MEENQTQQQESGLVVLLKENSISESTALLLSSSFEEFYNQANEWSQKATAFLSDPALSDEEKAKEARTARLALVKVRTGIEKKRKELNEEDQQKITDRNSAAKVLTGLVVPTEELLLAKEKEAEIADQKKKNELKEARAEALKNYNVDCTFFDLANMPDEAFKILLENSQLAFQKKAEDEVKADEERQKMARVNQRITHLSKLGFLLDEESVGGDGICEENQRLYYNKEIGIGYPLDLYSINEIEFQKQISNAEVDVSIFAEKKKVEENRLKAEKEELERKNQLLEQQEKERKEKHGTAIYRQEWLSKIGVTAEYDFCANMSMDEWVHYTVEQKSIYEAEQNRLFIEKKKKERDEAITKIKQKIVQDRIDQVIKLDFEFAEMRHEWFHKDPDFHIFLTQIEELDGDKWNLLLAEFADKLKNKRDAELAPDKEKLKFAVSQINFNCDVSGHEAQLTLTEIFRRTEGLKKWAYEQIEMLK